MADNSLHALIPIHLDGLYVPAGSSIEVAPPMVDFTRLDGPTLPYLGQSLASKPRSKATLGAGVHLHWALPDALTKTMGVPLVRLQPFQNIFGTENGKDIWQALLNAQWLQKTNAPETGKVIKKREERTVAPGGIAPGQLAAVNALLDHAAFPAVPDRWLVTRFKDDGITIDKQWVVESDFVWPVQDNDNRGRPLQDNYTAYPVSPGPNQDETLKYCFLGCAYELGQPAPLNGSYLPAPLTTVGYGEPAFAAFYPNCRSVFGFCDIENASLAAPCTYEVIGWYNDPAMDYFAVFVADFLENPPKEHPYTQLLAAIKEEFQWFFPIAVEKSRFSDAQWKLMSDNGWLENGAATATILATAMLDTGNTLGTGNETDETSIRNILETLVENQLPGQTLFYARNTTGPKAGSGPVVSLSDVALAVGNTGTEAMSAFLAEKISTTHKGKVEDYLEALQLSANLQQQQQDLGPKFEEARHNKGFTAMPGGTLWAVRSQSSTHTRAGATKAGKEITLPDNLADMINELNILQQQLDQASFQIESQQQQIFVDWCSYILQENTVMHPPPPPPPSGDAGGAPPPPPGDMGGAPPPPPGDMGGAPPPPPGDMGGAPPPPLQDRQQMGPAYDPVQAQKSLADMLAFIEEWEIGTVLSGLLEQKAGLQKNLQNKYQAISGSLLQFQKQLQYLGNSDITDWDGFIAAISKLQLPAIQSINFSSTDRSAILQSLNQKLLDDPGLPLAFPGSVPPEAAGLQALKGTGSWTPEVYLRYNRLLLEAVLPGWVKHMPHYQLQPTAAPRYWQPTEPVFLLAGIPPSPRYGHDGRLRNDKLLACSTMTCTGTPATPGIYASIASKLEAVKTAEPDNFALHPKGDEWHPLMWDWEVGFLPANDSEKVQDDPYNYSYDPSYITQHYSLGANMAGFSTIKDGNKLNGPIPLAGRCIMTPAASLSQKKVIIDKLAPDILNAVKKELPALDGAQFASWVKDKDPDLAAIAAKQAPRQGNGAQLITSLLNTRLANTSDGNLPGIVSWYWKQALKDITAFGDKLPDPDTHIDDFVQWAMEHIQLKAQYFQQKNVPEDKQDDFYLQNDADFLPWLRSEIGNTNWSLFFAGLKITSPKMQGQYLYDNFNTLINWFQARARSVLHTVMDYYAYKNLYSVPGLSQALGGFNKALLSLSQSFQLNIANPQQESLKTKAPAVYQQTRDFTAKVRAAVQGQNFYSPDLDGAFCPIRAGKLSIMYLNLINTFGQYWPDTDTNLANEVHLARTEAMAWPGASKDIALAPRLAQPTRLNFRWLSADASAQPDTKGQNLVETNSHPATSPVCGWFLANNLDNSLMVYNKAGQPLGYISQEGHWRVFPGQDGPAQPGDIDNPHLSQAVQRLCRLAQSSADNTRHFIPNFITILDKGLDNCAPDNSSQHYALSLLMGRPVALARAAIRLEQKGSAAINQGAFREDLGRYGTAKSKAGNKPPAVDAYRRTANALEQVQIPLRLGEFRQLNDGLLGYWIDNLPAGAALSQPPGSGLGPQDIFYAPQSFNPASAHPAIVTHSQDGEAFQFNLSLAQEGPVEVSMLIDPRGKIHATCGVLPVKSINLPPDQYQQALSQIEITFLTAPLLTLPGRIHLSVPDEPGYGWSWVEKEGPGWKTTSTLGTLSKADLAGLLGKGADVDQAWKSLMDKGWITATGNSTDTALAVPIGQRASPTLDGNLQNLQPAIENLLERTQISPFDTTAAFSGSPEIREGWLKLSKNNVINI